jgi:uncharacterized protein (TIGR02598 family)
MINLFVFWDFVITLQSPQIIMSFRPKRSKSAFTLVETILAIGIVAFAMLPILGLVPVGLSNLREAVSFTAESQILQSLSNDILLTDYNLLVDNFANSPSQTSWYNDEGTLLPDAGAAGRVYTVKVELKDVSPPADSSITPTTSKCAIIEITNIKFPLNGKKYSLIVPKT